MATNRIYEDGRYLYLEVGSGIVSGDKVLIGEIVGVAQYDADSDNKAVIDTEGVYELDVSAVDTAGDDSAISVGDPIYWDDGTNGTTPIDAGTLTPDNTNGTLFGYALEAVSAGTTDATIKVKLK